VIPLLGTLVLIRTESPESNSPCGPRTPATVCEAVEPPTMPPTMAADAMHEGRAARTQRPGKREPLDHERKPVDQEAGTVLILIEK